MSDISRRTILGAGGTAAAATILAGTGTGTAHAAGTDKSGQGNSAPAVEKRNAIQKETDAPVSTTSTLKFEAYVINDEGEEMTRATFDPQADAGEMWAYVDAVRTRYAQRYPSSAFTGHVQRYDQVITEIPHP